jgi:penicillin-binding protein 1A
MNFSQTATAKNIRNIRSRSGKYLNKLILIFSRIVFVVLIAGFSMGISACCGLFMGIIDNTPKIKIDSIIPMGYATSIYDAKGNTTDTLVMAGSNREEAVYDELPKNLINAFVAIEDSRFWQHNGVDTRSIMRAVAGIVKGDSSSGGGSTITQQLIKNNVFNGGREKSFGEKLERKLQEQYLAIELEKSMDKKLILTNYLNTINLGNNTLGVKVAARRYFNKEVSDLTLSECAVIAGITQNPSRLNPISGQAANAEKRKVILQYMFEQGYITKAQQEEALADNVYSRIQNADLITRERATQTYSYFTDELVKQVMSALQEKLGYSETQAHNLLYSGGLSVYSTQDPDLQTIVDSEINNPENYPVTRYSVEYRLSIKGKDGNTVNYSEETLKKYHGEQLEDNFNGLYATEDAAKKDVAAYKAAVVKEGDQILGESLHIILEPQDSFVLMEQATGQVKALSGGRGEKTASLTLNRASGTLRQPGSTFKVLSSFAPALDACGATLGTVYYDAPYTVGTKTFRNWYNQNGYLGWSSIRDGIIYSMNIVAVRCLMETVTPQMGVDYCQKFGITSLTKTDYNAATALGGLTYGVSNLELTGAFSSIANGGVYTKPVFFTKILDHNGKVLIDNTPETHRVLKDSTAFLLTDAMASSMQSNHKFSRDGVSVSSTSPAAKIDNMSCAGKSGTTSNNNDIWFVGFTPYYTAGIWAGCDNNQSLTENGGSSFHKLIWKKIMTAIHEGKEDTGFPVPDSVEQAEICRKSGKLAVPGICSSDPRGNATYTEYFAKGTVPTEMCDKHASITVCAESGGIPTPYCTDLRTSVIMVVPESEDETDDSVFSSPGPCTIHTAPAAETQPAPKNPGSTPDKGTAETVSPGTALPVGPGYQTLAPRENTGPGVAR